MKWMSKILIMLFTLVVFSSANAAIEKSVGEIAAEARVSSSPVNTDDMNLWELSDNDIVVNIMFSLASDVFFYPGVQLIIEAWGFHPELHKVGSSPLNKILDIWLIHALFLAGLAILVGFCIYLMRNTYRTMDKEQINKNWLLVAVTLGIGFFLQPKIFFSVLLIYNLFVASFLNYSTRYVMLGIVEGDRTISDTEPQSITKLSVYDTNDQNYLLNGLVEDVTKHSLLSAKALNLTKKGWNEMFSTGDTKAVIFNNIENNVNVVPVARYKGGTVSTIDYIYNEAFDGYDEDKYGPASVLFTASVDNMDAKADDEVDSDILRKIRVQGMNDGAKILSASDNYSLLVGYENIAYELVTAGKHKEATGYVDTGVIQNVQTGLSNGLKSVFDELTTSGLSVSEKTSLYTAYSSAYVNSVLGFNPDITQLGKLRYARKAQLYIKAYNCSQFYEKNLTTRNGIEKVNSTSGAWLNVYRDVMSLNLQCVSIMNGQARFMGVDAKASPEAVTQLMHKSTASAIALNLLKSNILTGAEYAKSDFDSKYSPIKNSIVSDMDKGFYALALNTLTLGSVFESNLLSTNSIRNSSSVSSASADFSIMVDLNKAFDNVKSADELRNDSGYSNIIVDYKPFIYDVLVNPTKSAGVKTYQEAKSYDSEAASTGEYLTSALQGHSTIITNMATNFGIPKGMSMSLGIKYCNASPANTLECNNRSNGTIAASLYPTDKLVLGVELKIVVVAFKALMAMNLGKMLDTFGLNDGNSSIGKMISKAGGKWLSQVTGIFTAVVGLINVMLVPVNLIANFLIGIGTAVIIMKYIPLIQMTLMVVGFVVAFIAGAVIMLAMSIKAVVTLEPQHFVTGVKVLLADSLGFWFYIIGFFVQIYFLYYVNFGPMQRAIYGAIAPEGGIIGMLSGSIILSFIMLMLHMFIVGIPAIFQQMKSRVIADGTKIQDEASVKSSVDNLIFAVVAANELKAAEQKALAGLDKKIAINSEEANSDKEVILPSSKGTETEGKK
ncbi:hypothetical protein ATI02_4339 [Pseudomonas baetica]|uniref:Uncharacterized protein n=1 Tax=Pseudomonas baetica TaxID=674054 RepID=A0ABX4Q3I6_9PSED|nr:hypothetical protein [Pseudomonas baetica]PKA71361.1 hypothetical protein ATI02_4339 [Pseudomonas baetica]PTC19859.1 hypothetical protein C0J26_07630 [Pseudomonas baetica]